MKAVLLALLLSTLADNLTTDRVLRNGGHETNPLLRGSRAQRYAVSFSVSIPLIVGIVREDRWNWAMREIAADHTHLPRSEYERHTWRNVGWLVALGHAVVAAHDQQVSK